MADGLDEGIEQVLPWASPFVKIHPIANSYESLKGVHYFN